MTVSSIVEPASKTESDSHRSQSVRAFRRDEERWFYTLIAPWLVGFVLLSLVPLGIGLFLSFTNYNGVTPDTARFVGFNNFTRAFNDPLVRQALGRTLTLLIMYVPLNFIIAMSLALMLNAGPRARGAYRSLIYIPTLIPVLGAAWIWKSLFNQNFGLVNGLLARVNPDWTVSWLQQYATPVLVSMSLWLAIGFSTIIYLAALQSVPRELEEAAFVDGAGYFRRLRHVTLPLITPVIFYQILVAVIYALQVLIEPILLARTSKIATSQSIPNDNVLLPVYVYQQMFTSQRFGYATALLWLTFLLALIVTLVLFLSRRFWVHSEVVD